MQTSLLSVVGDGFHLDGQPFRIIGGSIHYARIPKAYWRDRLEKLIELGCNTVETYVFWNAHEPYPGRVSFDDMLDVVAFVELAGSMGLKVIVRPGPYACAEWDMGGIPWWLLNEPGLQIRCSNPAWLRAVEKWWKILIPRLAPLQSTRGGPIIAMQFENEYGYFGNDKAYLAHLRDLLRSLGIDVLLFTSDGTYQRLTAHNGGLEGTLRTANYGSGAAERFKVLREFQPTGPLVCMEFWVGWFDEWRTGKHSTRDPADCAKSLDEVLGLGASVVIYMFTGGTNFGFTAGGNLSEHFQPYVTSYDYDALLSEAGDITEKYRLCRDVIHKHLKIARPGRDLPGLPKKAYGSVELSESVSLEDALPFVSESISSATPLSMEQLGHGRGFVLYKTQLGSIYKGEKLVIRGMHDWCNIRINGKSVATWYRRDPQPDIILQFDTPTCELEILVHNLARSNFGHQTTEHKGITQGVFVGPKRHEERLLCGWTCHAIPLNDVKSVPFSRAGDLTGPGFYRGTLQIEGPPADAFLALPGFELGCVFVNGFNVGRYWSVGPQKRLYIPAPILKTGGNVIVVFEASQCKTPTIDFGAQPELA